MADVGILPGTFPNYDNAPLLPRYENDLRAPPENERTPLLQRQHTARLSQGNAAVATDDVQSENGQEIPEIESGLVRKPVSTLQRFVRAFVGSNTSATDGDVQSETEEENSPIEEENQETETSMVRTPESTLQQHLGAFDTTDASMEKILPTTGKFARNMLSATTGTATFLMGQAINSGAVKELLPPFLDMVLPATGLAGKATRLLGNMAVRTWNQSSEQESEDFPVEAAGQSSLNTRDAIVAKRLGKTIKFNKFNKLADQYFDALINSSLTLKDNAQSTANRIVEGEKLMQLLTTHPELELPFIQLRKMVDDYDPPQVPFLQVRNMVNGGSPPNQRNLDPEIKGVLKALIMMAQIPYLSADTLARSKEILKTPEKQKLFDDSLKDVLEMAADAEVENPKDMQIFHERWRNLSLSDKRPFMLLQGDGGLDLARKWCRKVREVPCEIEADDLFEIFTANRPKDAKPHPEDKDPSPEKKIKGFYSRIESGNPTSPLIITGFDPKNADHANLIPLVEEINALSFPYKSVANVFNFSMRGSAVLLCEDSPLVSNQVKFEIAADNKDAATDKGKDKSKKAKDADNKTSGKEGKAKTKTSDDEKTQSVGFAKLQVMCKAVVKAPSESRRSRKLDELLETKIDTLLNIIVQTSNEEFSSALRACIKDTVSTKAYKDLIVKKSHKYQVTLGQTEDMVHYLVEHVASEYRKLLQRKGSTESAGVNPTNSIMPTTQSRIEAFNKLDEKQDIDKQAGTFIENYFERFKKEAGSKAAETNSIESGSDKKISLTTTPDPATLNGIDIDIDLQELKRQFSRSIALAGKQRLPTGQTTLDRYFQPGKKSVEVDPLLIAAKNGKSDELKPHLANKEYNPNVLRGSEGDTMLHLAVKNKHEKTAGDLLDHPKIDINTRNNKGKTALHLAVGSGNLPLVKLILRKKKEEIDFSIKDKQGKDVMATYGDLFNSLGYCDLTTSIQAELFSAKLASIH